MEKAWMDGISSDDFDHVLAHGMTKGQAEQLTDKTAAVVKRARSTSDLDEDADSDYVAESEDEEDGECSDTGTDEYGDTLQDFIDMSFTETAAEPEKSDDGSDDEPDGASEDSDDKPLASVAGTPRPLPKSAPVTPAQAKSAPATPVTSSAGTPTSAASAEPAAAGPAPAPPTAAAPALPPPRRPARPTLGATLRDVVGKHADIAGAGGGDVTPTTGGLSHVDVTPQKDPKFELATRAQDLLMKKAAAMPAGHAQESTGSLR
eukprot:8602985-Pyramimonas_sp.AAC.1